MSSCEIAITPPAYNVEVHIAIYRNTERLVIEVIGDRIKHAELPPSALNISFQVLREHLAGD